MKKTNKQLEQENLKLKKQVEKLQNIPVPIEGHKDKSALELKATNTDVESIMLTFEDRLQTLKSEIGRTYQFMSKMKHVNIDEPVELKNDLGYIGGIMNNLCTLGDLTNSLSQINNQLEIIA